MGAVIAVLLVVLIIILIVAKKQGKIDGDTSVVGDNTSTVTTTPFVTPVDSKASNEFAQNIESLSEAFKVGLVAKVFGDDGTVEDWELVIDKKSGICKVYKNGEDTGEYSATDVKASGVLMSLDDALTATNINTLPISKIDGAYDIDKYTAAGVVKFLLAEGAREVLEVTTSDYIDVFLIKSDGVKCRVLITNDVMFYTDGEIEIPSVENYINIK